MKKFRVQVQVEDYWDYVVEARDEEEARERAYINFGEVVVDLRPTLEILEVPEDTPLGDL